MPMFAWEVDAVGAASGTLQGGRVRGLVMFEDPAFLAAAVCICWFEGFRSFSCLWFRVPILMVAEGFSGLRLGG